MNAYDLLVRLRTRPMIGRLAYLALKVLGVELPRSVKVGRNLYLVHGGFGVVIHPMTVIEDDVRIYPGVTVGRGDVYRSASESRFEGLVIRSGAILGAGAKILCSEGVLVVGRDSVIGANAVLTQSTGDGEIWAGVPARVIGCVDERYRTHCLSCRADEAE